MPRLQPMIDQPKKYWCYVHKRPATHMDEKGRHCCDPTLGGITVPCQVIEDSYKQVVADLRLRLKQLGGVKLKMETFSWGPSATFVFEGPEGQTHRAGNVAPTWWTSSHIEIYHQVALICEDIRPRLKHLRIKLPGLLRP